MKWRNLTSRIKIKDYRLSKESYNKAYESIDQKRKGKGNPTPLEMTRQYCQQAEMDDLKSLEASQSSWSVALLVLENACVKRRFAGVDRARRC